MATSTLGRDTELRLASEVRVTIVRDELVVEAGHGAVRAHASLLGLLDVFQRPRTIDAALAAMGTRTALDWMELSADIVRLHRYGVLVADEVGAPAHGSRGFGSARPHIEMLDDVARTMPYLEAIREVVQPGDVVLDLGTGTGVLAIAAVKAGARCVFAVERSAIADVAARMFAENGVTGQVTLMRDFSTRVELPERADVMVSEIVGNGGFDEQILTYTRDALARLLVEVPRLIPGSLRLVAHPVSLPHEVARELTFDREATTRWESAYGLNFSALVSARPTEPFEAMLHRKRAGRFLRLGPGVEVVCIDLLRPPADVSAFFELEITERGALDAVVVHVDIDLGAGRHIVTDPWEDSAAKSWGIPTWLLPHRLEVEAGSMVPCRYVFGGARASLQVG